MADRSRLRHGLIGGTAAAAMLLTAAAGQAQLFWNPPDFRGPAVKGDEPGIGIPLPGATAAELNANLLWNMRAGLNVAALQCQFAPSLMTVPNYNALLAHHAKEFAGAFKTMGGYFTRTKGKGKAGQNAFDQYTTRTYNGFSTLHAQLGFCQTAGVLGRGALGRPKGQLAAFARDHMREFRNSLIPVADRVYTRTSLPTYPQPRMDANCWDRRDQLKPACANWRPALPSDGQAVATMAR